jgi:Protein of unknown function (DUF1460)
MRTAIVIASFGTVFLLSAAVHLSAIAQNQKPIQNQPIALKPTVVKTQIPELPSLNAGDRREFNYIQAKKFNSTSLGSLVQAIATEFKGYPYAADLLDQREPEALKISLQKFDCVLFVEAMLGLARTMNQPEANLVETMQAQRYQNGQMQGYCSRLHYFSAWLSENERQGRIQDLGESLGGIPLGKSLDFMSANWQKYPRLANNPDNRTCIQTMEQQLGPVNRRYVPTDRVRQIYPQLQAGDIVAMVTRIQGLDVTHTGLVYQSAAGEIGLIHAAPNAGVIVSPDLQNYLQQLGNEVLGIFVSRPI